MKQEALPLLALPDDVLANVLQRCPPGSIAGFPLPLALAQVRLTGSVDPNWMRPLLHLASKCPAVLRWLSPHLRSIKIGRGGVEVLEATVPQLTRLECLECRSRLSPNQLATLLRLTGLEELDLGSTVVNMRGISGTLPRLRRLRGRALLETDLVHFAPSLQSLAGASIRDVSTMPTSLTRLEVSCFFDSLCPLAHLTGLRELVLHSVYPENLLADLTDLTALTRLEVHVHTRYSKDGGTPKAWEREQHLLGVANALKAAPPGLDICLPPDDLSFIETEDGFQAITLLAPHLVDIGGINVTLDDESDPVPWATLTRLTRLGISLYFWDESHWIQPLSQLPSLRDLEVRLEGSAPDGFGALTQCTRLEVQRVNSATDIAWMRQLTRLQCCRMPGPSFNCLAALPDCITQLELCSGTADQPFSQVTRHLSALEVLAIRWPRDLGQVCDFSELRRF